MAQFYYSLIFFFSLTIVLFEVDARNSFPCNTFCTWSKRRAQHLCRRSRFIRDRCRVARCHKRSGRRGWECRRRTYTPRPSSAPLPSPIVIPRGCTNRCYGACLSAFRDCHYRKRPVSGCGIVRCMYRRRGRRPKYGWKCGTVSRRKHDVDDDGTLNNDDLITVLRSMFDPLANDTTANPRADVNRDGRVDFEDAKELLTALISTQGILSVAPLTLNYNNEHEFDWNQEPLSPNTTTNTTRIFGSNPNFAVQRQHTEASVRQSSGTYSKGSGSDPTIDWDDGYPYNPDAVPELQDYWNWVYYGNKLVVAETLGVLEDGTRAYRHYREGGGAELTVDYNKAIGDDDLIRRSFEQEVEAAKEAVQAMFDGEESGFEFHSTDSRLVNSATENWQKALGGHRIWSVGTVTFLPETSELQVDLTVKVEDFYNFNKGQFDIATGLPDNDNGRFEVLGWSSSFYSRGEVTRSFRLETDIPTPPPRTPEPTQPPPPDRDPGSESTVYTDPHIRTFDGLSYDCQAIGEFTLSKSEISDFDIQARFSGPSLGGTVTKGLAIRVKDAPVIQLNIALNASADMPRYAGCPVLLYTNGSSVNLTEWTPREEVNITAVGNGVTVRYSNGISVYFRMYNSAYFGCYLESIRIFLPRPITRAGDVVGLLGSPSRNPFDDWTKVNGDVIDPPRSTEQRLFKPAYDYCTTHWCLRDAADSLFTYEEGYTFGNFSRCDLPFGTALNFSSAPAELRALCGDDAACLVDGLAGGLADARNALRVQAEADAQASEAAEFKFVPAVIAQGSTTNVFVTLDVRDANETLRATVEGFAIYRVDSDSGERIGGLLVTLFDDGSGVTSDETAGDFIFSNVLPLRSETGGERFSFHAVPIIAGTQQEGSPLVATALGAVRSYSTVSGIGERGTNETTASTRSIDGMELLVRYSWPVEQPDLDTATSFAGSKVGFSCPSSSYMAFSGDDTSNGGTETVVVALERAREDGVWTNEVRVQFFAHWHGGRGVGPATLRMVLRDAETKREVDSTRLSRAIDPGAYSGCSINLVGELVVQVAERVTLSLFSPDS